MTGLNRQAFEALLPKFAQVYERSLLTPLASRQRAPGGGRKATLRTIDEKLFYVLLYCKCYPTFDLLSVLFNFDRSCAHDWVHRLLSNVNYFGRFASIILAGFCHPPRIVV
jgi:hypothetical protein